MVFRKVLRDSKPGRAWRSSMKICREMRRLEVLLLWLAVLVKGLSQVWDVSAGSVRGNPDAEIRANAHVQQAYHSTFRLEVDSHGNEDWIGSFLKESPECQQGLVVVKTRFVELPVLPTGLICMQYIPQQRIFPRALTSSEWLNADSCHCLLYGNCLVDSEG